MLYLKHPAYKTYYRGKESNKVHENLNKQTYPTV